MGSSRPTNPLLVTKSTFLSLIYHDIFDYPLSEKNLRKWEVRDGKVELEMGMGDKLMVEKTGQYYHLPGRADMVMIRSSREKLSRKKLKKAKILADLLGRIPTIKFIGLSGSLAMRNAVQESDIDFLIITQTKTLWATRALVHLFLLLSGRARWGSGQDSLCLNMWLDVASLVIPKKKRNIYSAHEVLQVVPLVNKENTFQKFVKQNRWTGEYWRGLKIQDLRLKIITQKSVIVNLASSLLSWLDPFAYRLQLWHMRYRRSCETVERGRAFFHPIDWDAYVMKEFESRIKQRTKAQIAEPSLRDLWNFTWEQ